MHLFAITLFVVLSETFGTRNLKSEEQCDGNHLTVNCRSYEEIAHMMHELRREVRSTHHLINDNCTVCWNGPCKNDGECVPLSETEYRCDCPANYKGKNCEISVECKPDSCGENAVCFVNHHMVYCVCRAGFTGDPFKSCTTKVMIGGMAGDPHYRTFDGQRYDYMGTCPYYFVVPCGTSFPGSYSSFWLKAKSELSFPNAHVSTVTEFETHLQGHIFHVDSAFNLYKDGIRVTMPYRLPNWKNSKVSITFKNSHITIRDENMITIYFSHGMLYVEMPDIPDLQGPDIICGLAGNRDSNCSNDFRTRDGHFFTPVNDSCNNRGELFTEQFGDMYITEEFMRVKDDDEGCLKGTAVANASRTCDKDEAAELCEPILDALETSGPFAVCKDLGEELIRDFFEDCVFDVCQRHGLICTIFDAFAKNCQLRLPNTALDWRRTVGCSDIHCPLHSRYSSCASACPLTCANPEPVEYCTETCTEGCECEPGYVLDDSIPISPQCVILSECGCKDGDGNYHDAENYWLTDECTVINTCENDVHSKRAVNCSEDGYCGTDHHFHLRCRCNKGYEGDGFTCEDVDECADPRTCNADKNQGVCTNIPGSYYCTCHEHFEGYDCELYRPRRHCADLFIYHDERKSGIYSIKLSEGKNCETVSCPIEVFCDMKTEEDGHMGGWTLMANTYNSTIDKTYQEYVDGFGDGTKDDQWIGLQNLHTLTQDTDMRLRVNMKYCATKRKPEAFTYCTYPFFKVMDNNTQYAVVIPLDCRGNDSTYMDGWVRWTSEIGPPFSAYDNDPSNCSAYYHNSGFWYDHNHRCGAANFNGRRYMCDDQPPTDKLGHCATWNNNPVSAVQLLLRPTNYPNYEQQTTTAAPVTAPVTQSSGGGGGDIKTTASAQDPSTDAGEGSGYSTQETGAETLMTASKAPTPETGTDAGEGSGHPTSKTAAEISSTTSEVPAPKVGAEAPAATSETPTPETGTDAGEGSGHPTSKTGAEILLTTSEVPAPDPASTSETPAFMKASVG